MAVLCNAINIEWILQYWSIHFTLKEFIYNTPFMCTTPLEAGVDSSPSAVHPVTRPDYHYLAGLPWTLEIVHSAVRHQLGCRDTHTLRLLLDLWNLLGVGQPINSQSDHQRCNSLSGPERFCNWDSGCASDICTVQGLWLFLLLVCKGRNVARLRVSVSSTLLRLNTVSSAVSTPAPLQLRTLQASHFLLQQKHL